MVLAACRMKYVVNRAGMMGLASAIFLVFAVVTSEVIARSDMTGPLVAQDGPAPAEGQSRHAADAKTGVALERPQGVSRLHGL